MRAGIQRAPRRTRIGEPGERSGRRLSVEGGGTEGGGAVFAGAHAPRKSEKTRLM
jgi:hypothetical protein